MRCEVDTGQLDVVLGRLVNAGVRDLTCKPRSVAGLVDRAMTSFTATGTLIQLTLRRGRVLLPVWIMVVAAFRSPDPPLRPSPAAGTLLPACGAPTG